MVMSNPCKTATGLAVALVLLGVVVSSHAQTAGLAYRLTVTIDGVMRSCGEALGPEYYVNVTRRDLEVENQIADANRDATLIAASMLPRRTDFRRPRRPNLSDVLDLMEFLRARQLNSELDPLSETERRSLEQLRGVRRAELTDGEEQELEVLASREALSSVESQKLQRLEELMTRSRQLRRLIRMTTSPARPNSLRVYLNDELGVVLMERDLFQDDTCLSSRVVLERSVLERQYLEIVQDGEPLLTLRFSPVEE